MAEGQRGPIHLSCGVECGARENRHRDLTLTLWIDAGRVFAGLDVDRHSNDLSDAPDAVILPVCNVELPGVAHRDSFWVSQARTGGRAPVTAETSDAIPRDRGDDCGHGIYPPDAMVA